MNRFALNHATTRRWSLGEAVDTCASRGVGIGLWREPVAEHGLARTAKRLRDAGAVVTSLCRGGFFTGPDAFDDNRRAVDEAHRLGTGELVLVSGGLPSGSRDLDGARAVVAESIAELVPHAVAAGVRLAIEPLHPMFASDRCVVSTLDEAAELASPFPPEHVGVVVDTYHVWWDRRVYDTIAAVGARIACFQVADWITPLPSGVLTGRGQLGDGCVELRRLRRAVDAAGYTGPIEVEIFNEELWARPGPEVFDETLARFAEHVAERPVSGVERPVSGVEPPGSGAEPPVSGVERPGSGAGAGAGSGVGVGPGAGAGSESGTGTGTGTGADASAA